ncbi:hypothetical protein [Peribacillus sp. NPDC097295]|uniref:hypothetical protein n=1 Tax=Peribacillus sp. NPDC097295 TaxID=3364402 RepID=UPI0038060806
MGQSATGHVQELSSAKLNRPWFFYEELPHPMIYEPYQMLSKNETNDTLFLLASGIPDARFLFLDY